MTEMRSTEQDLHELSQMNEQKMARMVKEWLDMAVVALKKENSDLLKRLLQTEDLLGTLTEENYGLTQRVEQMEATVRRLEANEPF